MMMNRLVRILLLASFALARPATFEEYLALEGDAASVDSVHREVRAPASLGFATEVEDLLSAGTAPKGTRESKASNDGKKTTAMKNASGKSNEGGYYKTYGSDAEGEKGYLKQTYSKGDHGYKSLDTFHKQDGDNYGFEKHTAFGKAKAGQNGGKHGKSGSYKNEDNDGAGTIVDTHYVDAEGDHAGYTGGEHYTEESADGGDSGHYVDGGDSGHYTDGGEGGHYTSGGDGSHGSYSHGSGSSEHFSTGGGDEGSHGTHGSYSTGSDGSGGEHHGYTGGYEGGY